MPRSAPLHAAPKWRVPLPKRRVSIDAAAAYADVSSRTIRRRIADGSLPAHRFGERLVKVDLNDVDKLFRRIPTAGDAA